MKNNYIILILFILGGICTVKPANDSIANYSIHIIDYSESFEYDTHYVFDNDEIHVYKEDKLTPGKKGDILVHRELLGKEKNKISRYLALLTLIPFRDEYNNNGTYQGERNQKRINFQYGDKKVSSLVSNYYQVDLARFVEFLNRYIRNPKAKMKEFVTSADTNSNMTINNTNPFK